jgi:L-gulono-1,4-lactone dehydrogenase
MSVGRRKVLEWGLGSAGIGAFMEGCGSRCVPKPGEFTTHSCVNSIKTDHLDETPETLLALREYVALAEREGKTIRMSGSKHSYSDAAFSKDRILSPKALTGECELPRDQLKRGVDASRLVRVKAGTRIREMNHLLLGRQLAFENLGGYDGQTIVGAALTGTHGSGLAYGPIASQLASIQVIASCGRVLQVEPSNGMTNPLTFPGCIFDGQECVPLELIQDDATFNALAVSAGMMGVIYAVVLRAVPLFYLRETRTRTTWKKLSGRNGLITKIVNGEFASMADRPDHVELYMNPYATNDGDHNVLLTKRWRERIPRHGSEQARLRGKAFFQWLQEESAKNGAVGIAHWLYTSKNIGNMLDTGLLALEDKLYEDVSYKVFNLGTPNDFEAYAVEIGVPVAKTIDAVDFLFATAKEQLALGKKHLSPPSLRFAAPSKSQLSMAEGRPTATIEIGMLGGGVNHPEILQMGKELLSLHQARFMGSSLEARPHLGLDLNYLKGRGEAERIFPKFNEWVGIYEKFNSSGVFNNPMTERLGISVSGGRCGPPPSCPRPNE